MTTLPTRSSFSPQGLIPAQEPLREALNWLNIADEADAWIKMTESHRTPQLTPSLLESCGRYSEQWPE